MNTVQYHKTRLECGAKVVTIPLRDRESVSISLWVRTGSRFERERVSGISHFLEHAVFKGTRTRSARKIKQEIEGYGGILDAFTGEESTCYYAKIMRRHFPRALDVLLDIVRNPVFPAGEVEKERAVILEEIKMYNDQPAQLVQDWITELLWPGQPLGRLVSGTPQSVQKISRADLLAHHKKYYRPENMVIVLAGPVSHEESVRLSRKAFSEIKTAKPAPFREIDKRKKNERLLLRDHKAEQMNFVIGVPAFSRYHRDRYKLGLLNLILGGNMSSRLFEELREKRGLAYDIRSNLLLFQDAGALLITAGVEKGKSVQAAGLILKEFDRLCDRPMGKAELRRAKDYFMSQFYMFLEDSLDYAFWVGETLVYRDRVPSPEKIAKGIEAVTPADIQDLSRRLFKIQNMSTTAAGPFEKGEEEALARLLSPAAAQS